MSSSYHINSQRPDIKFPPRASYEGGLKELAQREHAQCYSLEVIEEWFDKFARDQHDSRLKDQLDQIKKDNPVEVINNHTHRWYFYGRGERCDCGIYKNG